MSEESQEYRLVQDCLRKLVGLAGLKDVRFFIGNVTSVDEDNRECNVDAVQGDEAISYSGVHLSMERNDGFINVPAIDSSVFCVVMQDGEVYALGFSDITKQICFIDGSNKYEFDSTGFIWNGGSLGGLLKINDLKLQWDALVAATKASAAAAFAVIDTQLIALGKTGGSAAAFATAATAMLALNKTTLEDTKIKH